MTEEALRILLRELAATPPPAGSLPTAALFDRQRRRSHALTAAGLAVLVVLALLLW
ncbi:MAG TPA: hypothetical protein VNV66_21605 [Pilimelia sp.]|nr:hypothetical protein [Pilimelia sp.]